MFYAVDINGIETLAEEIVRILRLSVPVDVNKAVKMLGGQIKYDSSMKEEAKIEKDGKGFIITLNTRSDQIATGRVRFSVAHELGHLFLHMGYLNKDEQWEKVETYVDSVYYRSNAYTTEELQANKFAAALLMPSQDFISTAMDTMGSNRSLNIEVIMHKFKVTRQAAIIRAKNLQITGS